MAAVGSIISAQQERPLSRKSMVPNRLTYDDKRVAQNVFNLLDYGPQNVILSRVRGRNQGIKKESSMNAFELGFKEGYETMQKQAQAMAAAKAKADAKPKPAAASAKPEPAWRKALKTVDKYNPAAHVRGAVGGAKPGGPYK